VALAVLTAGVLTVPSMSGAASTTTCHLSAKAAQGLGPSYVLYAEGKGGYKVRGTSCASGKAVIKSFHSCRLKKGKKGRCTTKVRGYSCTDKRPSSLSIPSQFTGNVTCSNGSKRVIHTYQQDT
jgi:hypothetical protein